MKYKDDVKFYRVKWEFQTDGEKNWIYSRSRITGERWLPECRPAAILDSVNGRAVITEYFRNREEAEEAVKTRNGYVGGKNEN